MLLKYNDLEIVTKIEKTSDKTGLIDGDVWCDVYFKIKNDKCMYESKRKTLTYKEVIDTIKYIDEFVNNNAKKKVFKYIKNYMIIKLVNDKDKKMIIELVKPLKNDVKNYDIEFNLEEIKEYVAGIKDSLNLEKNNRI